MRKRPERMKRLSVVFFLIVVAIPLIGYVTPAAAESVEVVVGEQGFNPPVIGVTEGELVELTFVYGDGELPKDNPHRIVIEGIGVESEELNQANPKVTVRFTAEQSGRFLVKCSLYCTGHERLQTGYIQVRPPSAAGAQIEAVPSNLKLAVGQADAPGAPVLLRAELTGEDGQPLEGVTVRFEQQATLIQTGWAQLGSSRTDGRGMAVLTYRPFGNRPETPVRAVFPGNVRYQESNASGVVQLAGPTSAWIHFEGVHLPFIGYWLLWTILACIWLTFVRVIYNVFRLPEPPGVAKHGSAVKHNLKEGIGS